MSALPDIVDAWRMIAARRSFEGSLSFRDMPRLRESLANDAGVARYRIEFDRDALQVPYIGLKVDARLALECQRTLEVFEQPVAIDERLGLIAKEEDEAALPPGYEPLLTASGEVNLAEVIEDELILALPVVPVKPGFEAEDATYSASPPESETNPFAALAALKNK